MNDWDVLIQSKKSMQDQKDVRRSIVRKMYEELGFEYTDLGSVGDVCLKFGLLSAVETEVFYSERDRRFAEIDTEQPNDVAPVFSVEGGEFVKTLFSVPVGANVAWIDNHQNTVVTMTYAEARLWYTKWRHRD